MGFCNWLRWPSCSSNERNADRCKEENQVTGKIGEKIDGNQGEATAWSGAFVERLHACYSEHDSNGRWQFKYSEQRLAY